MMYYDVCVWILISAYSVLMFIDFFILVGCNMNFNTLCWSQLDR